MGAYAYVSSAELFNTAYLSSVNVTSDINMYALYDTYFTADTVVTPTHCEYLNVTSGAVYYRYETVYNLVTETFYGIGDVSTNVSSINTITFSDPGEDYLIVDKDIVGNVCQMTLREDHTYGKGAVHIKVGYEATVDGVTSLHEVNVTLRVWFPFQTSISMSDYYLDAIAGAKNPLDCGRSLYQQAAVTATTTFVGYDLADEPNIDVLPYVTFGSSDTSIITVTSSTVYGQSPGRADISIVTGSAELRAQSVGVFVRDDIIQVGDVPCFFPRLCPL